MAGDRRPHRRTVVVTVFAGLVTALCVPTAPITASVPPTSSPESMTAPCPDTRFQCVTVTVPRDHADPDGPTWQIDYAVKRATVESRGAFVTLTGGPGSSGLAIAGYYVDAMGSEITDYHDVVFIDQRGADRSEPFRCDAAAVAYFLDDTDLSDRDAYAAATERFTTDCVAESGVAVEDLPYYSTAQGVEDLEAIRADLGAEQLTLYGESYGTQFAQAYATAHPDRVALLLLDGVVDLTLESTDYYEEAAHAFDDSLVAVLTACDHDERCHRDAGVDALTAYDELAATLAAGPISFGFPLSDGTTEQRSITTIGLQSAATYALSWLDGRADLQRAITSAVHGDLVPLARLSYDAVGADHDTLTAIVDPTWSPGLYYAVECQDYSFFPGAGTPRERLDAWLDRGVRDGIDDLRLGSVFYGDVPCLFWPSQPAAVPRPAPITDAPFPTLVLNADTDGPTPVSNALRVFTRLDDAALVLLQGGPHVIFGWGYECVDDLVRDAVAADELPEIEVTICAGELATPYVGLPLSARDDTDTVTTTAGTTA